MGSKAVSDGEPEPACVTVKVSPATLMVPVRGAALAFSANERNKLPGPVACFVEVRPIQLTSLRACQAQTDVAFTCNPLVPPLGGTETLDGVKVKLHGGMGKSVVSLIPKTNRIPMLIPKTNPPY